MPHIYGPVSIESDEAIETRWVDTPIVAPHIANIVEAIGWLVFLIVLIELLRRCYFYFYKDTRISFTWFQEKKLRKKSQ